MQEEARNLLAGFNLLSSLGSRGLAQNSVTNRTKKKARYLWKDLLFLLTFMHKGRRLRAG